MFFSLETDDKPSTCTENYLAIFIKNLLDAIFIYINYPNFSYVFVHKLLYLQLTLHLLYSLLSFFYVFLDLTVHGFHLNKFVYA